MDYETILLDRKDGVGTITLNRPDKLNAYTPTMHVELLEAAHEFDVDPEVRIIVLRGAGRVFCAGADLGGLKSAAEGDGPGLGREFPAQSYFKNVAFQWHSLVKPTIVAIHGAAIGVGITLPLACDIRIAAEGTRIGPIFAERGVVPEFGASHTLPRLVGIAKACELVLTSKTIETQEAREIGLVNQVVPADQLMVATMTMARRVAELPPLAIQLSKRLLYQGLENDLATATQMEALAFNYCIRTNDHAEAVKAFLEKRRPCFKGE